MGMIMPSAFKLQLHRAALTHWRRWGCVSVGLWGPWRHVMAGRPTHVFTSFLVGQCPFCCSSLLAWRPSGNSSGRGDTSLQFFSGNRGSQPHWQGSKVPLIVCKRIKKEFSFLRQNTRGAQFLAHPKGVLLFAHCSCLHWRGGSWLREASRGCRGSGGLLLVRSSFVVLVLLFLLVFREYQSRA